MHGVSEWLFELFGRFDGVAFFVLPHDGGAGDRLVEAAARRGWEHVYVLQADLQQRAPRPMQNALLNPQNEKLSAMQERGRLTRLRLTRLRLTLALLAPVLAPSVS